MEFPVDEEYLTGMWFGAWFGPVSDELTEIRLNLREDGTYRHAQKAGQEEWDLDQGKWSFEASESERSAGMLKLDTQKEIEGVNWSTCWQVLTFRGYKSPYVLVLRYHGLASLNVPMTFYRVLRDADEVWEELAIDSSAGG